MRRENIPTWTISCYTQHTTSQPRSRVASLAHRGEGEGGPTCGGGFLPLPEEEENMLGADDSEQEDQKTLCYTVQLMVAVGSCSRSCILPM